MSRQKMTRVEETLDLCGNIEMIVATKSKGRLEKECRGIEKFVTTKVGKSSQKFVVIIVFMWRQNLPRSTVHGKERISRHLKLCHDNYKME